MSEPINGVYNSDGGLGHVSNAIDMNDHRITDVGPPVEPSDAATKAYVDSHDFPHLVDDLPIVMTTELHLGSNRIRGVGNPEEDDDATNKGYVDTNVQQAMTSVSQIALASSVQKSGDEMTGDLNLRGHDVEDCHRLYVGTLRPMGGATEIRIEDDIDMQWNRIRQLNHPQEQGDAVSKGYLDLSAAENIAYTDSRFLQNRVYTDSSIEQSNASKLSLTGGELSGNVSLGNNSIHDCANIETRYVRPQQEGQKIHMGADIDMGYSRIINLLQPGDASHAVNRGYVDVLDESTLHLQGGEMRGDVSLGNHNITDCANLFVEGIHPKLEGGLIDMRGHVDMRDYQIVNLEEPVEAHHAVNKGYVDALVQSGAQLEGGVMNGNLRLADHDIIDVRDLYIGTIRPEEGRINMGGDVDMNYYRIVNLEEPIDDRDAATKNYVDTSHEEMWTSVVSDAIDAAAVTAASTVAEARDTVVSQAEEAAAAAVATAVTEANVSGSNVQRTGDTMTGHLSLGGHNLLEVYKIDPRGTTLLIDGELDMMTRGIRNVGTPIGPDYVVNKQYVDQEISATNSYNKDGSHPMEGNIDMAGWNVTNTGTTYTDRLEGNLGNRIDLSDASKIVLETTGVVKHIKGGGANNYGNVELDNPINSVDVAPYISEGTPLQGRCTLHSGDTVLVQTAAVTNQTEVKSGFSIFATQGRISHAMIGHKNMSPTDTAFNLHEYVDVVWDTGIKFGDEFPLTNGIGNTFNMNNGNIINATSVTSFSGLHTVYAPELVGELKSDYMGLIASSVDDPNLFPQTDGLQTKTRVGLAPKKKNDRAVFGVFVYESEEEKSTIYQKDRVNVLSIGEGLMWVVGPFTRGDYITTHNTFQGYGMVQEDDLLHNYTVAKVLHSSCDTMTQKVLRKTKRKRDGAGDVVAYLTPVTIHCG